MVDESEKPSATQQEINLAFELVNNARSKGSTLTLEGALSLLKDANIRRFIEAQRGKK